MPPPRRDTAPDLSLLLTPERIRGFRAAWPFPYLLVDQAIGQPTLHTLRQAVSGEPHWANQHEMFDMMASRQPMHQPALLRFTRDFGAVGMLRAVDSLLDEPGAVSAVGARSYLYSAGHFLLPHHDFGTREAHRERRLAWVLYLSDATAFTGGELELFGTGSSVLIAPQAGQLILFEVSARSLHQVREVTRGVRSTLSGWFNT